LTEAFSTSSVGNLSNFKIIDARASSSQRPSLIQHRRSKSPKLWMTLEWNMYVRLPVYAMEN
jgi:hypothetical protein